ncbi:bifunctional N-acetylglucosamine-1-phosphate uridyltransferase/glucosamine-1-phosphate acetyltransferase [Neoactinobaculum massilliense]|uniref:bifunctional UDP-N-acetylglucosamine diphosphorylase/glucosamine-1-phosphate N-acetyltransferase GlmU n=1 Tax=Neoactinobaculum massilliense TaxID=2364794 RepID=UPI0024068938|nr:NTP transferase domain-containing protein [Neoactinobaculum massilliense]
MSAVIILAAGQGTRMKSSTPKVLHSICGRTLLGHAIHAARGTGADQVVVVVRHERDKVAKAALAADPDVIVADQDEIKGTGRAVQCGLAAIPDASGTVVVMAGDTPLLDAAILRALMATHVESALPAAEAADPDEVDADEVPAPAPTAVTVLTATLPNPFGYGRILRDHEGIYGVVEEKDATPTQRTITEVNTSTYAFDADFLRAATAKLGSDNAQGEVYLTDVVAEARAAGRKVASFTVADYHSVEGANDLVQLAALRATMRRRINESWMREGVEIIDPASTYIDCTVRLSPDVRILPGTMLLGDTVVENGAMVGPGELTDMHVGANAEVSHAVLRGGVVAAGEIVPPFSAR